MMTDALVGYSAGVFGRRLHHPRHTPDNTVHVWCGIKQAFRGAEWHRGKPLWGRTIHYDNIELCHQRQQSLIFPTMQHIKEARWEPL